jgi:protein transport protein SEC13
MTRPSITTAAASRPAPRTAWSRSSTSRATRCARAEPTARRPAATPPAARRLPLTPARPPAAQVTHLADLGGHEGPVWSLAWAHPRHGGLLASAGADGRVVVWREAAPGAWQQAHASHAHGASVNSVAWAPAEAGLAFAAASADGALSVVTCQPDGSWAAERIEGAHPAGACAVSWAPAPPRGSLLAGAPPRAPARRLASGGADSAVRVWAYDGDARAWAQEGPALAGHSDWVRDVAWAPGVGAPGATIASAGQDGRVVAWAERADGGAWEAAEVHAFGHAVWRLSWSAGGGVLAAADAAGATSLWKEAGDGRWAQIEQ